MRTAQLDIHIFDGDNMTESACVPLLLLGSSVLSLPHRVVTGHWSCPVTPPAGAADLLRGSGSFVPPPPAGGHRYPAATHCNHTPPSAENMLISSHRPVVLSFSSSLSI